MDTFLMEKGSICTGLAEPAFSAQFSPDAQHILQLGPDWPVLDCLGQTFYRSQIGRFALRSCALGGFGEICGVKSTLS